MIVLPGGMPGTLNWKNLPLSKQRWSMPPKESVGGCYLCAPSILGHMGMLENKRFTCFPGFEQEVENAQYTAGQVVRDGKIITAKGRAVPSAFALEIMAALAGNEKPPCSNPACNDR